MRPESWRGKVFPTQGWGGGGAGPGTCRKFILPGGEGPMVSQEVLSQEQQGATEGLPSWGDAG